MSLSFEQVLPDLRKGAVAVSQGKRYKLVTLRPGHERLGDKIVNETQLAFAQLADDGSDQIVAHVALSAEQIVLKSWTVEMIQVEPQASRYSGGTVLL